MKDPLFQSVAINKLKIKNRIYMPAMHMGMAKEFEVTDQLVTFYAERAKGGAGLICVGYATIDDQSGSSLNIGAHEDRFIPGLSKLAQAIKDNGSLAAVQLNHAGRYNFSFFMDGKQPVAPSAIASRMTRETPRALEIEEIKEIVQKFAQAAERVKRAGFDALEVLAGTGYLISEFLSPLTNQRNDEYGGSPENRMRFGLEVMEAIRKAVGPDYPLIVRINGNDLMSDGLGRLGQKEFALALAASGNVDCLCINVGWHEARVPQIVTSVPRGAFAYLAGEIKDEVEIPVIASHRINDPFVARELIANGQCDLVAMGRSLITDPQLPNKAKAGREDEIVHCIGCAQGCFDNLFRLKHVECLANPRAGHELEFPVKPAPRAKKVLVVGGGAAGMMAALAARDKGHDVVLVEKGQVLGGQLHLAATPPGREEFAVLAADLATQVRKKGVEVLLGQEADLDFILGQGADQVILATGGKPITPGIPGAGLDHVVQAWEVLQGRCYLGKRIVIIGGGAVGVETALYLAEKGTLSGEELKFLLVNGVEDCDYLRAKASQGKKDIIVLEMLDKIGKDIGKSTRWTMLQELGLKNVQTHTGTKALEITPEHVLVQRGEDQEKIPADNVVLAVGTCCYNPLEKALADKGIDCVVVGDAKKVRLAFDAIHAGFKAGYEID